MEQKRVPFKVAKAIKEAGYPQDKSNNNQYYTKSGQLSDFYYCGVPFYDVDCFVPTYLDVWIWLWREKKISIDVDFYDKTIEAVVFSSSPNGHEIVDTDPEEAIIAAIEYIVEHNLIK